MAHIPQAQVEGFFRDMRNAGGGEVAVAFGARAAEFFANDDKAWSAAIRAARLGAVGKANAADVERVLDATIFSKDFMARYAKNCRITCQPGEPDLYHEQREWLVPLLRLALRDRRVATFQLENWNATLLVPAAANARLAGIDSEAGIISVASAQSSATSWGRQIARAAETGRLAVGDLVWPWNHHPFKPEATAAELHDWRVLATWQWYCAKKRGIRNRSVAYFNAFLKDKWELPTFDGGSKGLKDPANWDPTKVKMKR